MARRAAFQTGGVRLESDFDVDDVGWTLYSYGCLDYYDEKALRKLLKPGDVCLDVGAHIGYFSLLFSQSVGPAGRVVSYEPVPYTHSFLIRNVQNNQARNVTVEHAAVGNRTGVVRMLAAPNNRLGWSTVSEDGDVEIRCTTIDAEARRLGLQKVNFLKMDVEGYELEVLKGGAETVEAFRPKILLEVNEKALTRQNTSLAALNDFFTEHRYKLYKAEKGEMKLIPEISADGSFFNLFAIPE